VTTTPWDDDRTAALREQFPFLMAHPELVYLDAAATTPMPDAVVAAVHRHLTVRGVNAGRGAYRLAGEVQGEVEQVRAEVAGFVGADADGLAFTSGATQAFDVLGRGWAEHRLQEGDEIILGTADHAATVGPWFALARRRGLRIVPYRLTASGDPDVADLAARVTTRTAVVVVPHVHHVHGERADVAGIRAAAGPAPVLVLDATHSVSHVPVDVEDLDVDAVVFSAHKVFGPPGVGVLWLSPRLREQLTDVWSGGIATGTRGVAAAVERGTLNTPGIMGLGAALRFVRQLGLDQIHAQVSALTHTLVGELRRMSGVRLLPGVWASSCGRGYGIVSLDVPGVPAADVGYVLDQQGICVRADSQCRYGARTGDEVVRISVHAYTRTDELERAAAALGRVAARSRTRARTHLASPSRQN